jgi:hypothetical protein
MATNPGDYIVDEALKAYESFCERLPRHRVGDARINYITAKEDLEVFIEWTSTYKRTHRSKWWRLMSHDDIVSCLFVLPLNPEPLAELTELVRALQHGSDDQ